MAAQFGAPTRPPMAPVGLRSRKAAVPGADDASARRTATRERHLRRFSRAIRRRGAADTASVDAVIAALYASVSHPDGQDPDWPRMRKLFLPVGMLVPPKRPQPGHVHRARRRRLPRPLPAGHGGREAAGETNAFYEIEVARQLDCFGNVCQAFSTYESRRAPTDEKPFTRGINTIQLLNDGQRWWIASIVWDSERPGNPIPPEYQKK